MKKDKQHSPVKAARKAIHERLIKELNLIAGLLKVEGIHTTIDVEKEAKKLAKKITRGAKVEHAAAPEAVKEKPAVAEAKKPVKENAVVKPKQAPKSPVTKVKKPVITVVTTEPPAAKPPAVKTTAQPKTSKK